MSVYFKKGKGYRYDFTLKGERYTKTWFKTKTKAKMAESERRKEVLEPPPSLETPTDMSFLELVNRRLDHVKSYNSEQHYAEYRSRARRWVRQWGHLECGEITQEEIEAFALERCRVSPFTANREICCLRATFNFGKKKRWIKENPTEAITFLPQGKKVRYVPPLEDIHKIIALADRDTQDYLWAIRDTIGRSVEINRLTWDDVDFKQRCVTLWTRKKKGGNMSPRKVPMTRRLFEILSRRHAERDPEKPWVFWHTYWSSKAGERCEGPYKERKKIMKTLCRSAGVRYCRFHALRHSGASVMDQAKVPLASIQRILGHENRTTTEIYLQRSGDSEREAITVFEQVTENPHTDSHTRPRKKTRTSPLSVVK